MDVATEDSLTRELRLDHRLDVAATLGAFRKGAGDPTTQHAGSVIWRTGRMPTGPVTYVVRQPEHTVVRAEAWGPGAAELLDGLRGLVGADDDLAGFEPAHPILIDALRRFPGLRVPRTGRVLEALMAAVIEQRVVGLDAFAAWRRLLLRFGEVAPGPAPLGMRVFPTAEQWAAIPSWEWHLAGVDPQRTRTAQACARVGPQLERLVAVHGADLPAIYRGLQSIPGVGRWTAAEVGSRALGDADAVPFGDYHVGKDVGAALVRRPLDDDELEAVLEPWRPHRFRVIRLIQLSPHARRERRGPRMPRVDHRHV